MRVEFFTFPSRSVLLEILQPFEDELPLKRYVLPAVMNFAGCRIRGSDLPSAVTGTFKALKQVSDSSRIEWYVTHYSEKILEAIIAAADQNTNQ